MHGATVQLCTSGLVSVGDSVAVTAFVNCVRVYGSNYAMDYWGTVQWDTERSHYQVPWSSYWCLSGAVPRIRPQIQILHIFWPFKVRFRPVQTGSARQRYALNLGLNRRSGSTISWTFELDLGPVLPGSGSNFGSGPNRGITTCSDQSIPSVGLLVAYVD
jgi:hypothetical protein